MEGKGLHVVLAQATRELKKPAGDSPLFATAKAIQANRDAFVRACHETWKRWHDKAVHKILVWDAFARREKTHPIGPPTMEIADYNRAIWRRINDSIIWTIAGQQRHVVKRLCLYRKRGFLSESNPESVLATLAQLNSDPQKIAIWNDATSCVDLGDITYVDAHKSMEPYFLELKEGKVNQNIVDLINTDAKEFETKFKEFEKAYGKKGVAQYHRVTRQKTTSTQALTLLHDEHGTDPVTGLELSVHEVQVAPYTYDDVLNGILTEATTRGGPVTEIVDGCLWVHANGSKSLNRYEAKQRFGELLAARFPNLARPLSEHVSMNQDRIVSLNECFLPPLPKPIFLRDLDPENVGAVIYGDLMFKVFLYLDWEAFGVLIREEGAEFVWSSEKDARRARSLRRELQPVMIRGRLPQVRVGPTTWSITDPNLIQLFFDGLTPRVMAKTIVEIASTLTEQIGAHGRSKEKR
jgi:hypothetical protein